MLHKFLQALHSDPDLHGVPIELRAQALQSLYICMCVQGVTMCHYSEELVKLAFSQHFFSIIAGGYEAPGSIGEVTLDSESPACLSFYRLVGTTYFRAHASAFEFTSLVTLYHSVTGSNATEKHEKWLQIISKAIWQ